jgi:hypothetical protein
MRKEKETAAEPAPPDESNLPKQRWYQFKQAKSKALPQTLSHTLRGKSRAVSLIDLCSAFLFIWSSDDTLRRKRLAV